MRTLAVLFASCVALAACNREPKVDVKNANASEVAEAVRESGVGSTSEYMVDPGKWSSKVTFQDMSVPGMTAEMQGRMKQMLAERTAQSFETCLTPEEAKRPKEDFFGGKNNQCKYDHFSMGGGKIDAKMRCEQQGVTQTMEMTGTYARDSYTMQMSSKAEGGPSRGMSMKMRIDSKRIGKCDGKEA